MVTKRRAAIDGAPAQQRIPPAHPRVRVHRPPEYAILDNIRRAHRGVQPRVRRIDDHPILDRHLPLHPRRELIRGRFPAARALAQQRPIHILPRGQRQRPAGHRLRPSLARRKRRRVLPFRRVRHHHLSRRAARTHRRRRAASRRLMHHPRAAVHIDHIVRAIPRLEPMPHQRVPCNARHIILPEDALLEWKGCAARPYQRIARQRVLRPHVRHHPRPLRRRDFLEMDHSRAPRRVLDGPFHAAGTIGGGDVRGVLEPLPLPIADQPEHQITEHILRAPHDHVRLVPADRDRIDVIAIKRAIAIERAVVADKGVALDRVIGRLERSHVHAPLPAGKGTCRGRGQHQGDDRFAH